MSTKTVLDDSAKPMSEYLDAAPFGRVASWNPSRTDGAQAKRTEEFRAEDVFLASYPAQDKKGNYLPTVFEDGRSCIGLEWNTRRNLREVKIEFSEAGALPDLEETKVEFWEGVGILQSGSAWQGKWVPLTGDLSKQGDKVWSLKVANAAQKSPLKIRWIFPPTGNPILVKSQSAFTLSPMAESQIALRQADAKRKVPVKIRVSNGWIIDEGKQITSLSWNMRNPLTVTVNHAQPEKTAYAKSDRTILHFGFADEAFGIAVDDIVKESAIWMERSGLYVAKAPVQESLEDYVKRVSQKKTVLDEVRAMPEQTREQAMSKTHYNPKFDEGAILISLAYDNNKFLVERSGRIGYGENYTKEKLWSPPPFLYYITPQFGRSRVYFLKQGWGDIGIDTAAHSGAKPMVLQIQDKTYSRGIGHHANGEMRIDLKGEYKQFEAELGVQKQSGKNAGSVIFQILLDGKQRFDSGVMRGDDAPKPVSVPVSGAKVLTLRVTDAGNGFSGDMANWAEARLITEQGDVQYLSGFLKDKPIVKRHLSEGWLPAPITETEVSGLRYSQRTFVAPLEVRNTRLASVSSNAKALAVAEVTIENQETEARDAFVSLDFEPVSTETLSISTNTPRSTIKQGNRLFAVMDSSEIDSPKIEEEDGSWMLSARIPAKSTKHLYIYLPSWNLEAANEGEVTGGDRLYSRFRDHWQSVMAGGMEVSLPDEWLTNVVRANQAHIFLAARNEEAGERIVPWIAALTYRQCVDSEGHSPLRAMIDFGHFDFARRAFDFYFANIKPEGFITTGYTTIGTGWDVWTLAEYLQMSNDTDWFSDVSKHPLHLCQWIMDQRKKTQKIMPDGEKVPEYGLMPPSTLADWSCYAYYFMANSHYQKALQEMGQELKRRGFKEAKAILADAAEYREEIQKAYRYASANAPAVALRSGSWVPYAPTSIHYPGAVGEFFPGEDASRSWCYDVELGAHHLAALGVMDKNASAVDDMTNYLEDVQFLQEGWHGYPASMSQEDWFNMGGFAKVQPYYARNAEIYAMRDDIKPFLRSYWNSLASTIDGEVLSIYEHFSPSCINKTHETGYFLHQTRLMLLMERDMELWLAPFLPEKWLEDGKITEVKNAPTRFGPVSYRIESRISKGFAEAKINPPTRSGSAEIVMRFRHPQGKTIKSAVTDDGTPVTINSDKQSIRLKSDHPISLQVHYGES